MKALVLTGKNEPMVVQELAAPVARVGEAIVQVRAAALNHRDVWIQKGQYAGLKYPLVPGADGSGVVTAVGPGDAALGNASGAGMTDGGAGDWIGKEVIINPSINWGGSPTHQDPQNFKILGLPDDGTFAEFVKVPLTSLAEKPGHLSFGEAAALPLAGLTAYRALFTRAATRAGEKILITGIGGGVALFALQYAVAAGVRVYVTSGSDEKIGKAIALGASGGINYTNKDWEKALQELAGAFDVIVDGASGDGMDALLNLAAPGGRLAFYGATRGNPSGLTARRIFWKQLTILGSTMGSPEDFHAMAGFVNRHAIRPVVDRVFPFEEGEAALRHMDDARQFGKIVIRISE